MKFLNNCFVKFMSSPFVVLFNQLTLVTLYSRLRLIIYLKSLIIHKIKTKEINTEMEFGYVRKNLHKLTQLSSQFSPKTRICFRCNRKHSEECFITYPNTSKCVKKTRLRLVFSTHFSVFGYVMEHSSSCYIYYLKYEQQYFIKFKNSRA